MNARMTLQIATTRVVAGPTETVPITTAEIVRTTTSFDEARGLRAPARTVLAVERLLFRHSTGEPARRILETTWRQWREPGAAGALTGLVEFNTVRLDAFDTCRPIPLP